MSPRQEAALTGALVAIVIFGLLAMLTGGFAP